MKLDFSSSIRVNINYIDSYSITRHHEFDVPNSFYKDALHDAADSLLSYLTEHNLQYDYEKADEYFEEIINYIKFNINTTFAIYNRFTTDSINVTKKINNSLRLIFNPEAIRKTVTFTEVKTYSVDVDSYIGETEDQIIKKANEERKDYYNRFNEEITKIDYNIQ